MIASGREIAEATSKDLENVATFGSLVSEGFETIKVEAPRSIGLRGALEVLEFLALRATIINQPSSFVGGDGSNEG